jgi:Phage integrase, N-terminal SAM-like domain
MARVRDLWYDKDRRKTARHPDKGGNKNAKRWLAVWVTTDGAEASRAFAKRSDAERYATLQEADAQRGIRSADPKRGAIALREYGESKFLPAMLHLRPNSADTYASHLRNHIYPVLGNRRLGTITRSDVQAFVTVVSGKVAASNTETVYAVLRAMMQHAVDDDPQVIPSNSCTRIRLPQGA